MARNGSGTYSLPAGNPVVTGTTISSTWANNTLSDIATALTNSIAKDGQTTPTANLPMGNFKLTGLGSGSADTDSANLGQIQAQAYIYLNSVSGTDTITASTSPVTTSYAAGQTFRFVAAGANTGAVTLNVNSLGAKSLTKNGATPLSAGDLVSGAVYQVTYDGTQFQLTNAIGAGLITGQSDEASPAVDDLLLISDTSESNALNKITLENLLKVINSLTEDTSPDRPSDYILSYDASASGVKKVLMGVAGGWTTIASGSLSGTSVDITSGIQTWMTELELTLESLSTNGTANPLIQVGDSGGIETSGYLGAAARLDNTAAIAAANYTNGIALPYAAAANILHATVRFKRHSSSSNTWEISATVSASNSASCGLAQTTKATSATLDRIRITTATGVDTYDGGTYLLTGR